MTRVQRILQGTVLDGHRDQVGACLFHRLLNRKRYFTGLAVTETDPAVAVTDHGQRSEAELTAAFDDLGHAIDRDQLFCQIVASL